jgi:type IV pilus assembly protein PilW
MPRYTSAHAQGISLVDLMVGLSIGMIATLIVLNVMVMFDARRRTTAGSTDAQIHGTFAGGWLARELRIAGHGLGPLSALGCTVHRAPIGTPDASLVLAPLMITNGTAGTPDTLTILAAGEQALPASRLVAPHTMGDDLITLDSTLGIANGSQLLLHESGNPDCPLVRVAAVSTGGYTLQPTVVSGLLSGSVFGKDSLAINLGALRYRRYSVDTTHQLRLESFDSVLGTWITSTHADGVVNLQLQYGFDTRSGSQPSPQVTSWRDMMIDADGDGIVADSGDWQRLLAVRFALVMRSPQRKEEGCDAPAPTWLAGDATGALVPTEIRLDHLDQWRCWRYRVLQTEVLLRNQLWGEL